MPLNISFSVIKLWAISADSEKNCPKTIWRPNSLDIYAQKLGHFYFFVIE